MRFRTETSVPALGRPGLDKQAVGIFRKRELINEDR